MIRAAVWCLVCGTLVWVHAASARTTELHVATGVESATDSYEISFTGGKSRLDFAARTPVIKGTVVVDDGDTALRISLAASTTSGDGTMEDRDWFDDDGHPGIDIYSETDLSSRLFTTTARYDIVHGRSSDLVYGAAFRGEMRRAWYRGTDTRQTGIPPIEGHTIDYDTLWLVPSIGGFGRVDRGRLTIEGHAGFAPAVIGWGLDDHLLRMKLSEAWVAGFGLVADAAAACRFGGGWSLNAGVEFLWVAGEGVQHQEFYDGPYEGDTYDVDVEMELDKTVITIGVSKSF